MDDNKSYGELGVGREIKFEDWLNICNDSKLITIEPEKDYSALGEFLNSNPVPVELNI